MMGLRTSFMWALMAGLLFLPSLAPTASAQNEGIKVHGDWVIEVRNPDGTLASRTEFKNALSYEGGDALLSMLARKAEPISWTVYLVMANDPNTVPALSESAGNLQAGLVANGLELFGSVRNDRTTAWTVAKVNTFLSACPVPRQIWLPDGGCASRRFTERLLPTPYIAVQPGQAVDVRVRISFS